MRRTPIKRGKPLERTGTLSRETRLERKTRLAPINRERRKKLYARNFSEHAAWIRTLPCDDCGATPPSDPHHTTSRGAGGDRTTLVPLCRECHTRRHQDGTASTDEIKQRAGDYWTRSPHYEERDDA